MKNFLILTSMFSNDREAACQDFLSINQENGKPFYILTPANGFNQGVMRTVSIALHIDELMEEFQKDDKPLVYIGPAKKALQFEEIIVFDKEALERQEKFLYSFIEEDIELINLMNKFYSVNQATKEFENIEEVFFFLKEVTNV